MLGGYTIINLGGQDIVSSVKIDGIYERLEASNKAKLVSGLVISGTEYDDMFLLFTVVGTSFVGKIMNGNGKLITLTITQEDLVTGEVEA